MSFDDLVAAMDSTIIALLGESVPTTYTPLGGVAVPVSGVFDEQYVLANGSAQAGVSATVPAVFYRISALPADPIIDKPTITIGGVDYRVREKMPDGKGGIVLGLHKIT